MEWASLNSEILKPSKMNAWERKRRDLAIVSLQRIFQWNRMALATFPGARFRNSGQRPKHSFQSFFHNYIWSRRLTDVCYLYHMPHDFLLENELCCDAGDWWRFNGSVVCSNAEPTILMHQIERELYHWRSVLLSGPDTNTPERNSMQYQSFLILLIFLLTPWGTKVIEMSSSEFSLWSVHQDRRAVFHFAVQHCLAFWVYQCN